MRLVQGPLRPLLAGRPGRHGRLFRDDDPERARRAMEAMFGMRKLDIAALRAAAEGVAA